MGIGRLEQSGESQLFIFVKAEQNCDMYRLIYKHMLQPPL
jgi:hypothetical protein